MCSKQFDLGNEQTLDASGYIGWKQINSSGGSIHHTFPSEPEVGLLLSYKYKNLEIFNQFKYGTDFDSILVYSFASLNFNITNELNINLRGGKIWPNFGLYGASKINPRTRQGIIQPQGIYIDSLNNYIIAGNGVQAELSYKEFTLSYSVMAPSSSNPELDAARLSGPLLNKVSTDFGNLQIANLQYDSLYIPVKINASFTRINTGNDFNRNTTIPVEALPNGFDYLTTNEELVHNIITLGVEYTPIDDLTLSSEAFLFRVGKTGWFDGNLTESYSFTARYDVHENITLYTNYNQQESVLTRKFQDAYGLPKQGSYARDINFGVNLHKNDWIIGLEAHRINGYFWNDFRDPIPSENPYWVTGMNIAYFFD